MSVKKRAASILLALGMLATTAPAFAADTVNISGDLAVQKSAVVSKNVAAESHSFIAFGASAKGQSVVAGQIMDVAVQVYMHESSSKNGERVLFSISKSGKTVYSEAVKYSDFADEGETMDAGLYIFD